MMRNRLRNRRPIHLVLAAYGMTIGAQTAFGQGPAFGPAVLPPPAMTAHHEMPAQRTAHPAVNAPAFLAPPFVEDLPTPSFPSLDVQVEDSTGLSLQTPMDAKVLDQPVDAGLVWYNYPMAWLRTIPWDSGVELGINGATGSNESVSIRTGGYIKRASEFAKIDISAYYNKTSAGGRETQSNAKLDIRNDWLLDASSAWTLFGTASLFYDEFQAFDLQANANGGVGYRVIDQPWLSVTGRTGGGASREFGGPDDDWVPEGMLGLEYDQKIASNQKLYWKIEYFPELEDVNEFRLVTDVGWEIELVQPSNVSLKLSLTDRYDSTPNGNDPQLLNYSVLLLWKM